MLLRRRTRRLFVMDAGDGNATAATIGNGVAAGDTVGLRLFRNPLAGPRTLAVKGLMGFGACTVCGFVCAPFGIVPATAVGFVRRALFAFARRERGFALRD